MQILSLCMLFAFGLLTGCENPSPSPESSAPDHKDTTAAFSFFDPSRFDVDEIKDSVERQFVQYGKELVERTADLIGPEVENAAMRFSGNNLTCGNCHLQAGVRPYSAPFVGVFGTYPNFRKRENTLGSIEDRLNGCMDRSMNGKKLPKDSKEMKALVAYIKFLSKGVPVGEKPEGMGFKDFEIPHRAADPEAGAAVYAQECSQCHGEGGQGLKGEGQKRYLYPPLWGPDSYNDGAGMARILTAARFIKANMPYGTPLNEPKLSDGEAYDVAAYINSHDRPEKKNKEVDYPDLTLKPIDCPYPPYADDWPIERHRLGPFIN